MWQKSLLPVFLFPEFGLLAFPDYVRGLEMNFNCEPRKKQKSKFDEHLIKFPHTD